MLASVSGSIGQAIEQARAAHLLGCPAAQITMVAPMFGMTDEGAERYNRAVAESADIGFMLYRRSVHRWKRCFRSGRPPDGPRPPTMTT